MHILRSLKRSEAAIQIAPINALLAQESIPVAKTENQKETLQKAAETAHRCANTAAGLNIGGTVIGFLTGATAFAVYSQPSTGNVSDNVLGLGIISAASLVVATISYPFIKSNERKYKRLRCLEKQQGIQLEPVILAQLAPEMLLALPAPIALRALPPPPKP